ncbi:MAG: protein jag [Clostridia bacterium]|nr:protein jag [Clostridia bacterium]
MSKVIISEGKTTNEAIEKGLKQLNTSKENVEIKVLEQEKRSFFDILAPRVVKVEITLKEEKSELKQENTKISENNIDEQDLNLIKEKLEQFLKEFIKKIDESFKYEIYTESSNIIININGEKSGTLIGYRGDTLNALQVILNTIANKNSNSKVRVHLNIDNYKEKREKALEELAVKVSKTVLRTNKKITLEPMNSYERKIIHTKLQNVKNIKTHSIGEDPNRKIVIEKINK